MGSCSSKEKELSCSTCGAVFTNSENKFTYLIHTDSGHRFMGKSYNIFAEHELTGGIGSTSSKWIYSGDDTTSGHMQSRSTKIMPRD